MIGFPLLFLFLNLLPHPSFAFHPAPSRKSVSLTTIRRNRHNFPPRTSFSQTAQRQSPSPTTPQQKPKSAPRSGLGQTLLNLVLGSPLWKIVLVPQARANIVKTAEANGIPWKECYDWLRGQDNTPWSENGLVDDVTYPDYYRKPFHAYEEGNLSWNAAIEQEIASRSIGARNFPSFGFDGEDAFRESFEVGLASLGAEDRTTEENLLVVDMGCGTGTSTRRLAERFPHSSTRILGVDLSPYMVEVAKTLMGLSPTSIKEGGTWVNTIRNDPRIEFTRGDAASTDLPVASVDIVNLSFLLHELPASASLQILEESHRILKPGGLLCVSEMDFDSPAYAAQRDNPLLFSLVRATEPYLDEYADGCEEIRGFLVERFGKVGITAATGRHYALVAEKGGSGGLEDLRFKEDGSYLVDDTHLGTFESSNR